MTRTTWGSVFPAFGLGREDVKAFQLLLASDRAEAYPADMEILDLIARACGEDFVPDRPVIMGQVIHQDGSPASDAEVVMTWSSVPEFLQPQTGYQNSLGAAVAGASGHYAVCGAPVGAKLVIHAELEGEWNS